MSGIISVQRAHISSSTMAFEQMSPSILTDGSLTGLYMKSDEVFSAKERVFYDTEGFGHLPSICRILGQENLPECNFFDIVYNNEAKSTLFQNIAATPVVFSTTGFSNETGMGNLVFQCQNCGAGFDENGNIDLEIFVGPTNTNFESRKKCIITSTIFRDVMQVLEVKCRMPPGENETVPIQLIWGAYLSPPYYVGYRAPSIEKLVFYHNLESQINSALHNTTHTITDQDKDKCLKLGTASECACRFLESECSRSLYCLWNTKNGLCMLAAPTGGLNISIFGKNFGSKPTFLTLYMGKLPLQIFSINFDVMIGFYEIKSEIPPMTFHDFRPIKLLVNGQPSSRTDGNPKSLTFFIRSAPPFIEDLDLGQNARTIGGYSIFIYGSNFGRHKEEVNVHIGNRIATVESVTDKVISVLAAPGQGRGQEIFVHVLNETSNVAPKTFDYSPPIIYGLETPIKTFPTNGLDANGDSVSASLIGDNFGVGNEIQIYFGDKKSRIFIEDMIVDHTQINFTVPPGEGVNLTISVDVSNQTGYSLNTLITYAEPTIQSVLAKHEKENMMSKFPASGCLYHEEIIRPNFVGVLCDVYAIVEIHGENFGRPGQNKVEFVDFVGTKKVGRILNSTHSVIEVILEAGIHTTSIRVYSVGFISNQFDRPSLPFDILYDEPRLDMIVFGEDIQSATISNTFDAQGKFVSFILFFNELESSVNPVATNIINH